MTCVYGGVSIISQKESIRQGVDVIIATPGRLNMFMNEGCIKLDELLYLVLDEADMTLEMGNEQDIEQIMNRVKQVQDQL